MVENCFDEAGSPIRAKLSESFLLEKDRTKKSKIDSFVLNGPILNLGQSIFLAEFLATLSILYKNQKSGTDPCLETERRFSVNLHQINELTKNSNFIDDLNKLKKNFDSINGIKSTKATLMSLTPSSQSGSSTSSRRSSADHSEVHSREGSLIHDQISFGQGEEAEEKQEIDSIESSEDSLLTISENIHIETAQDRRARSRSSDSSRKSGESYLGSSLLSSSSEYDYEDPTADEDNKDTHQRGAHEQEDDNYIAKRVNPTLYQSEQKRRFSTKGGIPFGKLQFKRSNTTKEGTKEQKNSKRESYSGPSWRMKVDSNGFAIRDKNSKENPVDKDYLKNALLIALRQFSAQKNKTRFSKHKKSKSRVDHDQANQNRLVEYESTLLSAINSKFDKKQALPFLNLFRKSQFNKFVSEQGRTPSWLELMVLAKKKEFFENWGILFLNDQNYSSEQSIDALCDKICRKVMKFYRRELEGDIQKYQIFDEEELFEKLSVMNMSLRMLENCLIEVTSPPKRLSIKKMDIEHQASFSLLNNTAMHPELQPSLIIKIFKREIDASTPFHQNRLLAEYFFRMKKVLKSVLYTSMVQETRLYSMKDNVYASAVKRMSSLIPLFGKMIGIAGTTWNAAKKLEMKKKLSKICELAVCFEPDHFVTVMSSTMTLLRRNAIVSSYNFLKNMQKEGENYKSTQCSLSSVDHEKSGKSKNQKRGGKGAQRGGSGGIEKLSVTEKLWRTLQKEDLLGPEILAINDAHLVEGSIVEVIENKQVDIIKLPKVVKNQSNEINRGFPSSKFGSKSLILLCFIDACFRLRRLFKKSSKIF